nr:MAG TPA: Portal protein [Caudoviricetes sp.]
MEGKLNLTTELQDVQYSSYSDIFGRFKKLSEQYGGMPMSSLMSAFSRTTGAQYYRNDPYIQNRRVQAISSLPNDFSKNKVAEMLTSPLANERGLRQVEHALEYTAYPLFHTRKMYQDLLTYHSYIVPEFTEKDAAKNDDFWREWKLLEKLRRKLDPKTTAHKIAGQAVQEGKVFYYPRISVDKPHNKVDYAFMQQLPSDWTKIVGFNSVSKYTVAFNLFYFLRPGCFPEQFGDLFEPYLDIFSMVTDRAPKGVGKKYVYAEKATVDMGRFRQIVQDNPQGLAGEPEVYYQNGKWFYWVTLPVDKIFTFEIDDANTTAVSPLTGLFLSLLQIAQYEQIQLELVQNPLISLFTGEIPYKQKNDQTAIEDDYRLSDAGRRLFEYLWYQMLSDSNTSGIGWFTAPVQNIKMHQLAEAPSATKISSAGYGYTMAKAGLSALIPTSDEPRAGVANISLQIESKFAEQIYRCYERMMQSVFEGMNLKYSWRFSLFGNIAEDADTLKAAKEGMTLGILPQTVIYLALHDMSVVDDLTLSHAISESGVLDLRIPLVSTYSAKQGDSRLPPQAAHDANPGGRPDAEGKKTSEGAEAGIDANG